MGLGLPSKRRSLDQARELSGVKKSGKLTNSEGTADTPKTFDPTRSNEAPYSLTVMRQWTAINTNETIQDPHDLTNARHRWTDEPYDASNPVFSSSTEVYQPETAWPQPSSGFLEPSQDPFVNPWTMDEDIEMVDQW